MPARTTHTCTNRHGRRVLIRPTGDKRVRFLIFWSAEDFYTAQLITVQTQVSLPEVCVASLSDEELYSFGRHLAPVRS